MTFTMLFENTFSQGEEMSEIKNGDNCKVISGTHKGKSGKVADINTSKGGNVTISVVQESGTRFKTLARSVEIISST